MASRGLVLSAPASGTGKTVITVALLSALKRQGVPVTAAKSGPDYIDPQFHAAATGTPSVNLDAWAMDTATLRSRAATQPGQLLIVEGAMGVLDGAGCAGRGSAAELASGLDIPLVMIVDVSKQAQSAPLAAAGLRSLCPDITIAGVILNRVGSARHEAMVRSAFAARGFDVLGAMPRVPELVLPERHLGLVQARENTGLDAFLGQAADIGARYLDLDAIVAAAAPIGRADGIRPLPPLGQKIAIAHDDAFAFVYPHFLADWHCAGADVSVFSPLADEAPDGDADAIFLPGGYPELHAERLSHAATFRAGIAEAAQKGKTVYGECGGYMVLGETLVDGAGKTWPMLGLLPLQTSFKDRRLHLGYRRLTPTTAAPWQQTLAAHEFHYASVMREQAGDRLFEAEDADGERLPAMGLRRGSASGSFAHVIGPQPD